MRKASYIFKALFAFFLMQLLIANYAVAQQIITNGDTNTTLDTQGVITNVSTTTIQGANAFNSFNRFNVDAGNTVNLIVPDNATNLINIVKNEASSINGTLNSLQNGVPGGNIYLVNPYGIVVGAQGAINVGSLTAVASTQGFVNTFFTSPGNPDPESVDELFNETSDIVGTTAITNDGTISAQRQTVIYAANIVNTGTIQMTDLVNVGNLNNGNVFINSESGIDISGVIRTAGQVELYAGNGSITEKSGNENPNIISNNVILQATQSIGALHQDINLASTDQANPLVNLIQVIAYNGDACLTMNQGDLNINNVRAGGHVYISAAGNILRNQNDSFPGIRESGQILPVPNLGIDGHDISLNASNIGNWNGGNYQPVNISLAGGMITSVAKVGIFLNAPDNPMAVNQIMNNGTDKIIVSANNGITNGPDDSSPNFITNDLILKSDNGAIGTNDTPINIDIGTTNNWGTLEARADKVININNHSDAPNLYLRKILSQNETITITTNSGLLEAPDHEEITIVALRHLNIIAIDQSSIGMDHDSVDIFVGGHLHAQAYGYVNFISHGNLRIDLISNAGRYPVKITVPNGYITNIDDNTPAIITNDLTLNAPKGVIDTTIDTNYSGKGGSIEAYAQDFINLEEITGDMVIDEIKSTYGKVTLTSNTGSILGERISNTPAITGFRIILEAANNIGGPINNHPIHNNCLFIQHDDSNYGFVSATAHTGSINIGNSLETFAETNKDIVLNQINAPNGMVYIQTGNNIYSYGSYNSKINTQTFSFYSTSDQPYRSLGTETNPIKLNSSAQIGQHYGIANINIQRY